MEAQSSARNQIKLNLPFRHNAQLKKKVSLLKGIKNTGDRRSILRVIRNESVLERKKNKKDNHFNCFYSMLYSNRWWKMFLGSCYNDTPKKRIHL